MSEPIAEPRLSDLVAALPEDLPGTPSREDELREVLASLSQRPVPTGRVLRLWSLGTLQARIAVAYGLYLARSLFVGGDERARLKNETHLKAAVKLLASMGYLRGAIMKVGQTLASYPNLVPDEYLGILSALHCQAPPMHFSLLREQVRRELGADPEDLFAEFDTHAVAAASLGQVHRARLKTGEAVAVKIQYPNIGRTLASDLKNMKALLAPMRLMSEWDNLMDCLDEVRQTFGRETDYELEARTAERVRALTADLEDVVVPRTFPRLCSRRVLTLEWIEGRHLRDFLGARPSQELRDLHGSQIMRVVARLMYARLILADPNPGNFFFLDDGRLGLVDFGCYRELTAPLEWDLIRAADPAVRGDEAALSRLLREGALLSDEEFADEGRVGVLRASLDWLWEPLRTEEPFDFGSPDYMRRGFDVYATMFRRYGYQRQMPVFLWTNRVFVGVRALAYELRARVPLKRINDEEWQRAGLGG